MAICKSKELICPVEAFHCPSLIFMCLSKLPSISRQNRLLLRYCKRGKHRSVATACILHHIFENEGFHCPQIKCIFHVWSQRIILTSCRLLLCFMDQPKWMFCLLSCLRCPTASSWFERVTLAADLLHARHLSYPHWRLESFGTCSAEF